MKTQETKSPGKEIYKLIVEAENDKRDRRFEIRFAFFRPVTILLEDGRQLSAFSRDISAFGIGLIHNFDLVPGEVQISISSENGYHVKVTCNITWCRSCGEGWYVSGGQFIGIDAVANA